MVTRRKRKKIRMTSERERKAAPGHVRPEVGRKIRIRRKGATRVGPARMAKEKRGKRRKKIKRKKRRTKKRTRKKDGAVARNDVVDPAPTAGPVVADGIVVDLEAETRKRLQAVPSVDDALRSQGDGAGLVRGARRKAGAKVLARVAAKAAAVTAAAHGAVAALMERASLSRANVLRRASSGRRPRSLHGGKAAPVL